MTRYYYPIPLLANFLHQLQWYLFIHHTFRRKYALWVTCLAELEEQKSSSAGPPPIYKV